MEEVLAAGVERIDLDGSEYVGLTKREENGTLALKNLESETQQLYDINNMSLLVKDSVIKRDLTTVEESETVAHSLLKRAVTRWTGEITDPSSSIGEAEVATFKRDYVGILEPFVLSDKKSNGQISCTYGFFYKTEFAEWDNILPLIDDLFSCTRQAIFQPDIIILKTPNVQLDQDQFKKMTQIEVHYRFVGINNGNVPIKRWSNENYSSHPRQQIPVSETIFIFGKHAPLSSPDHLPFSEDIEVSECNTLIGEAQIRELSIKRFLKSGSNFVVFLGEGNFSFCTSVASLRKTWRNIVSSDIRDVAPQYGDLVNEVCQNIIKESQSNRATSVVFSDEVIEFIADLCTLDGSMYLTKMIDARQLQQDMEDLIQPRALFFNCPWYVDKRNRPTSDIVEKFFESARTYQTKGNLIFLGITTSSYYIARYKLFDEKNQLKRQAGYVLRGADKVFVREMIKRGYRHWGGTENPKLHDDLKETHVVLVYERE